MNETRSYDSEWTGLSIGVFLIEVVLCATSLLFFFILSITYTNFRNIRELVVMKMTGGRRKQEGDDDEKEETKELKLSFFQKVARFIFSEVFNIGFYNEQNDNVMENNFMLTIATFPKLRRIMYRGIASKRNKALRVVELAGTICLIICKVAASFYCIFTVVYSEMVEKNYFFMKYSDVSYFAFGIFCFYQFFSLLCVSAYLIYLIARFWNNDMNHRKGGWVKFFYYLNYICWNLFYIVFNLSVSVTIIYSVFFLPLQINRGEASLEGVFDYVNLSTKYIQTIIIIIELLALIFLKFNVIQISLTFAVSFLYFSFIDLICHVSGWELPHSEFISVQNADGANWINIIRRYVVILVICCLFIVYFLFTLIRGLMIQFQMRDDNLKMKKKQTNKGFQKV